MTELWSFEVYAKWFSTNNLSISSPIPFRFCKCITTTDSWFGIVNEQNWFINDRVMGFSSVWKVFFCPYFLCFWNYLDETFYIKDQRLHIVHKSTTLVAFILELFALDTSKFTLHASDQWLLSFCYTLPQEVAMYYVIFSDVCLFVFLSVQPAVCLVVNPSIQFLINNLSISSWISFEFSLYISIGNEWFEIVN